jgi:exo-beta-1,3-glucanase (GH17 family)
VSASGLTSPQRTLGTATSAAASALSVASPVSAAPVAANSDSPGTVAVMTAVQPHSARCTSTDDSYSDFNFWKIPPALLDDEY